MYPRAVGEPARHNFAWKERRGQYRLHPLYAYRWGSRKQRALLAKLGKDTLTNKEIIIPSVRKETSR